MVGVYPLHPGGSRQWYTVHYLECRPLVGQRSDVDQAHRESFGARINAACAWPAAEHRKK